MNVQTHLQMDREAFLEWNQGREGRYELVDCRVQMMTGATRVHVQLTRRFAASLEQRLDPRRWMVLASDFAVDIGPRTVRYPDVVVDVAGGMPKDLAATAPSLIAEILSPATSTLDLGDKASEYLRLSSLTAYLVFAQNEPKAWAWVRGPQGFPAGPAVVTGEDTSIEVAALALSLPLAETYAGILKD